jgi:hypothetical protein
MLRLRIRVIDVDNIKRNIFNVWVRLRVRFRVRVRIRIYNEVCYCLIYKIMSDKYADPAIDPRQA